MLIITLPPSIFKTYGDIEAHQSSKLLHVAVISAWLLHLLQLEWQAEVF